MVIDSSALLAVMLGEQEAEKFEEAIMDDAVRLVSAVSGLETSIVLLSRRGQAAERDFVLYAERIGIDIVAFDAEQLSHARDAFWRYGKGRHAAGLNFGDCATYALVRSTGEPLLYKGNDFGRTDVIPVMV